MRSRLFSSAFVLCIIPLLFCECGKECSNDQVYYARFSIVDKQTGKPYFNQSNREVDSLRVYQNTSSNSLQPVPVDRRIDPIKGYVFGDIDIIDLHKITLYIKFNKSDLDTLVLINQITPSQKQCGITKYLTDATYNGRSLKSVSNDTTSFASFELSK
jgi:hypothetical protein